MRGRLFVSIVLVLTAIARPSRACVGHGAGDSTLADAPAAQSVCSLSPEALTQRSESVIAQLAAGVQETAELDDGYALRFPGSDEWAQRLVDFIRFERRCCSSFTLELVFERDSGAIWLRLRGAPEVKAFVAGWVE